jgi:hypothetical protein
MSRLIRQAVKVLSAFSGILGEAVRRDSEHGTGE